jgi:hypothetical protein
MISKSELKSLTPPFVMPIKSPFNVQNGLKLPKPQNLGLNLLLSDDPQLLDRFLHDSVAGKGADSHH